MNYQHDDHANNNEGNKVYNGSDEVDGDADDGNNDDEDDDINMKFIMKMTSSVSVIS